MKVRLWQLGSLEHNLIPTKDAIEKLRSLVNEKFKDDTEFVDIVWGPDLKVSEAEVIDEETIKKIIDTM